MLSVVKHTAFFLLVAMAACTAVSEKKEEHTPEPDHMPQVSSARVADTAKAASPYTFNLIAGQGGTHGYEILQHGKKIISQPNIPAVAGTKGFATAADAEKVARFAIDKMVKGTMPPTISPDELKELGVLK